MCVVTSDHKRRKNDMLTGSRHLLLLPLQSTSQQVGGLFISAATSASYHAAASGCAPLFFGWLLISALPLVTPPQLSFFSPFFVALNITLFGQICTSLVFFSDASPFYIAGNLFHLSVWMTNEHTTLPNKKCSLLINLTDHNMVLGYNYIKQKRQSRRTNVPPLLAILIAMAVQQCNTNSIAQCGMSMTTSEATGRRHWTTTCFVLPRRPQGQQQTKR